MHLFYLAQTGRANDVLHGHVSMTREDGIDLDLRVWTDRGPAFESSSVASDCWSLAAPFADSTDRWQASQLANNTSADL